jgi:pullulanase
MNRTCSVLLAIALFGIGAAISYSEDSFDNYFCDEKLGCTVNGAHTDFALFAPSAADVELFIFDGDLHPLQNVEMQKTDNGIWRFSIEQNLTGKLYSYRIEGDNSAGEMFNPAALIGDPYSSAVVTFNDYHQHTYSIIVDESFNWEGDKWVPIDQRDLVIYEMHIRDMTADKTSGTPEKLRGTYSGLISPQSKGGINHLRTMGVNAVELLPAQEFDNIELPYMKDAEGLVNNWNPYARNHWGYMTSYFCAPESYYASDGNLASGNYSGKSGNAVKEFKQMVKALHKEGIAVLMDVVYNHTSQYGYNPLKYIDKKYYYILDENNNFIGNSGCGNDLDTSRPMTRKLIIDSLKKWVIDYHIDGFRFDLAAMIDGATLEEIRDELKAVNPNIILIAEPWGGGNYDPSGMSEYGYAAWNDVYRNTIKGQNPNDGKGLIFGNYWGGADIAKIQSLITGFEREDGGYFQSAQQSVNYLESHDDNTMGDFIRMGLGAVGEKDSIADVRKFNKLTPAELQTNKLGAFFLFTSKGPIMLAEGQEYARGKVIAPTKAADKNIGRIDHNSYNKDNASNWLNYDLMQDNRELVDFYRNLIKFRKDYSALRQSEKESYKFISGSNTLSLGYKLGSDKQAMIVLYNCNPSEAAAFNLDEKDWKAGFWGESVQSIVRTDSAATVTIKPSSGCVLVKKK